jgi:site-specific DNA recombinase
MPKAIFEQSGPTKVAIYARSSSDLQSLASPEDQIRECRDAARRLGWTVLDEYVVIDQAKTGQVLLGRDGLEHLIELAQQKPCPFDGIMMDDTSRFGRNLSDTLPMTDTLKYAGVFLYFVSDELDSRHRSFRSQYIQLGQKDEQYSVGLGDKVHRGQRGRVLNGFVCSGRLYGYINVPVPVPDEQWRYGRAATLGVKRVVNEKEVWTINRIFDMYIAGRGYCAIARVLNEEGIPSPARRKGKPMGWSSQTIHNILQNEAYRGIHIWNRTKTVLNPKTQRKENHARPVSEWERMEMPEWRIVSDAQWEAVANERARRHESGWQRVGGWNRANGTPYLFSGLLSCAECGGNISIVRGRRHPKLSYGCTDHRNKGFCKNNRSIMSHVLESQLIQVLTDCCSDPAIRDTLSEAPYDAARAAFDEAARSVQDIGSNQDDLQKRKADLTAQAGNLLDAVQYGRSNGFLAQRLDSIQAEIESIDSQLAVLDTTISEHPTREGIAKVVEEKLAEIGSLLREDSELARHRLRGHISKLVMSPIDTADGPRYEVTGEVRLFSPGEDGVELTGSFKRTCKQYTPLSFTFNASLIVRAWEWEKKTKSAETRKKIGDANRML